MLSPLEVGTKLKNGGGRYEKRPAGPSEKTSSSANLENRKPDMSCVGTVIGIRSLTGDQSPSG